MISLKKLINSSPEETRSGGRPTDRVDTTSAYQAALAAMGAHGQRAVPILGDMLASALARISEKLDNSTSAESVCDSQEEVEQQLVLWADKAELNHKENEGAIKELLHVIAGAAEATGNRDEKFGREIAALSERLRVVAGLENLPLMRRSIAESAGALSTCVVRMAEEGRESIRKLTSEVTEYQARLQASERRALVDPLTGLCNRTGFERQMEHHVAGGKPFSLLVADLNGFKAANDQHGHLVGDEILRQFAAELKAQFRPEDTVARWGGDEFAAIVGGSEAEGGVRAERVRHWALGEYRITLDNKTARVKVDAAIGTVAWDGSESGSELFERADQEMYRAKASAKKY